MQDLQFAARGHAGQDERTVSSIGNIGPADGDGRDGTKAKPVPRVKGQKSARINTVDI